RIRARRTGTCHRGQSTEFDALILPPTVGGLQRLAFLTVGSMKIGICYCRVEATDRYRRVRCWAFGRPGIEIITSYPIPISIAGPPMRADPPPILLLLARGQEEFFPVTADHEEHFLGRPCIDDSQALLPHHRSVAGTVECHGRQLQIAWRQALYFNS